MPPFNLWVRTAPRGAESFCWRIDLLPRLAHPAGLEMGAGVQLCVLAPERAPPSACATRDRVIAVAAVIAAATAVGFGVEHRLGERADAVARRVVWLMLWVLGPPVVFVNIAALEVTAEVGAGIGFAYAALARDAGGRLRDRHLGAAAAPHRASAR